MLHSLYKYITSKISFSNRSDASLLPNAKGPGTSFQAAVFVEFFHEIISFGIWYKPSKQTVFTSEVVQEKIFLALCVGIWWRHEIWKSKILKFDFLENEKSFWSEMKTVFLVWQVLLFGLKQNISKNVADTSFKWNLLLC